MKILPDIVDTAIASGMFDILVKSVIADGAS